MADKVKVKVLAEGENPTFEELMRQYQAVDQQLETLKTTKAGSEQQKQLLRELIADEVSNMGLGRGSRLQVAGVGRFGYTTKRYYRVPKDRRLEFVRLLIERGEEAMLTIGERDLNKWCRAMEESEEALPDYVKFHEDKFVPQISPVKTGE